MTKWKYVNWNLCTFIKNQKLNSLLHKRFQTCCCGFPKCGHVHPLCFNCFRSVLNLIGGYMWQTELNGHSLEKYTTVYTGSHSSYWMWRQKTNYEVQGALKKTCSRVHVTWGWGDGSALSTTMSQSIQPRKCWSGFRTIVSLSLSVPAKGQP